MLNTYTHTNTQTHTHTHTQRVALTSILVAYLDYFAWMSCTFEYAILFFNKMKKDTFTKRKHERVEKLV